MRRLVAAALASALASTAPAQAPSPPKLIVAISVDQLGADLFDEYRPHFTAGLKRLSDGIVFGNGYQGQAATETCPGHSTILTGALPARSGIIGNSWLEQSIGREDKTVYCAEDETVPGSSSRDYSLSAIHLAVPTLGDLLKKRSPGSKNVAIAGKDRSAVMMGGHDVDQRWYWKGGRFVTDLAGVQVPRAVTAGNAAIERRIAAGEPSLQPPPLCQDKARPIDLGKLTVGGGRFAREPGDESAFRESPDWDGATLALAAGLVEEMQLGRDAAPDILSIGLSATDYVGHAYGSEGEEMCLNLLSLDRELGAFFDLLDRDGLDYVVVLTADHGVEDIPERLRQQGRSEAQRADAALSAGRVGTVISEQLGLDEPALLGGIGGDVYVRAGLTGNERQRVINAARRYYSAHPQVQAVFSKAEIQKVALPTGAPDSWSLIQRARASFDPKRSGDLLVVLKPWVAPLKRPSVISATSSPRPAPLTAPVTASISRIPGPPTGPSLRMTITSPGSISPWVTACIAASSPCCAGMPFTWIAARPDGEAPRRSRPYPAASQPPIVSIRKVRTASNSRCGHC